MGKKKAIKVDIDTKWQENVARAKEFCEQKKISQMRVAELALEVCEITWGGYHLEKKYTLKRFADEIGMSMKALSTWCAVRRMVYEKLPKDERDSVTFTKLHHIALRVTKDSTPEFVVEKFKEIAKMDSLENTMLRHLADVRSATYNFAVNDAASRLNIKTVEEFLFYAEKIRKCILKEHKGIKPKDHGLCAKNALGALSAARALGLERGDGEGSMRLKTSDGHGSITITPKDRDIVQFMKKKDVFWSPTEIGMKLGRHNASSASAWAYRSLNKLQSLGAVERNTKGQYRWIGLPGGEK